jgi:hypothetical protein
MTKGLHDMGLEETPFWFTALCYIPEYHPLAVKLKSKHSDILHDFPYVCIDCKIQPKM